MFCSHRETNLWNILATTKCWIGGKISPIKQISNSFTATANQIMIVFKIDPQGNRNTIIVFHPSYKRTKFLLNICWDSFVEANVKFGKEKTVNAVMKDDFAAVIEKKIEKPQKNIVLNEKIKAPVKKGDVIGKIEFKDGDKVVAEGELVAEKDIPRKSFFGVVSDFFKSYIGKF